MASKRAKRDVEAEDRTASYLKDGCFPDSEGTHPDELLHGKITLYMLTWPRGVATPSEQAELVASGVRPHTGKNMKHVRGQRIFGCEREASSVPADLYKVWYNYFRGRIAHRRAMMRACEEDVKEAKERLDHAHYKYVLPGDWQFGTDEEQDGDEDEEW